MGNLIVVGISDYKLAKNPGVLVTYALGSCVGICIYDRKLKIGGLSHIMLPDSTMFTRGEINRMKFADTAICDMINILINKGADKKFLSAKIAGGAQMFKVQEDSQLGNIGERNIKSVKNALSELRIPLLAEDTGLNYGRTVYFDIETGIMKVQSLNRSISEY
ncbi:MAG: chemotaxis protein CheD [Eubacteriales bacterium]|nr:chemotaxis protein CheD [Eubacteriales bacterium]